MYRVFGSPYALMTHQAALYLRQKEVPVGLHISSLWGTKIAGWWHRSGATFGYLSPEGKTLMSFPLLVDDCEARHPSPRLVPCSEQHPNMKLASSALTIYGLWWLMNTGGVFRWIHGEGSQMCSLYASYFLVTGATFSGGLGRAVRAKMVDTLKPYGMDSDTEPYFLHHFWVFLQALETHLADHRYLLGTPHATLADVAIASTFECFFLQDQPPANDVRESPNVHAWMERMSHAKPEDQVSGMSEKAYKDEVPQTLVPILQLALEVLPWLAQQCDAMKMWYSTAASAIPPTAIKRAPFLPSSPGAEPPKGHTVDRLLTQPWEMTFDGLSVPCLTSVPHVHQANWIAESCMSIPPLVSKTGRVLTSESSANAPASSSGSEEEVDENSVEVVLGEVQEMLGHLRTSDCFQLHQLLERGDAGKYGVLSLDQPKPSV